jgi:hypothetical protein
MERVLRPCSFRPELAAGKLFDREDKGRGVTHLKPAVFAALSHSSWVNHFLRTNRQSLIDGRKWLMVKAIQPKRNPQAILEELMANPQI